LNRKRTPTMEKIDPGPIEGRVMRNIRLHAKRLARSNTSLAWTYRTTSKT
jgi:hypothetical protein